jgi:hypothetical protein
MYIVELTLKNTPMPLSVQRKAETDAEELYQKIVAAMRSGSSGLLELTCDRQPDKKVTVLSQEICAVTVAQKSATANTGKPPGFAALVDA